MSSVGASSAATAPRVQHDEPAAHAQPLPVRRRRLWKDALRRRMLAAADLGAMGLAVGALGRVLSDRQDAALWAVGSLPLGLVLAKVQGLYDADHRRLRHLTSDEIPSLFMWIALWVAATALALSLLRVPGLDGQAAALMWAIAFGSVVVLRASVRAGWRRLVPREGTLVLGSGEHARRLARKLTLEPGHHVTLLDAAAVSPGGADDELEDVLRRCEAERVVVAREDLDEASLREVVGACRATGTKLSVVPRLPAVLGTAVSLTHLAELPLIELNTWDPSRSTMLLKRTMDVVLAALGLALLAPLLAAIALAIRLDSPGPVLFRQRRAGRGGQPFPMLKFRSMVADAEASLGELVDLDALEEPMFKLRADPRITRAGRVLRRWSLDELPQLLNVLAGSMSLVGPRPEELRLVARYSEAQRVRVQMRPGMTGPMQVHGRGELTFEERVAIEREYVENHALRRDVALLLRTVGAVVRGRGAF